jgi:UPF0271 protein
MAKTVDLNVDIGEGFAFDEALLDFATSANVCLGAHAGSRELTLETISLCNEKGVRIGLHPGFPDRDSMGRARMSPDDVEWYTQSIFDQVAEFSGAGAEYVKPHGAWYNMLTDPVPPDPALFRGCKLMLDGVVAMTSLPVMMMPNGRAYRMLVDDGDRVISEGFADRRYLPDGTLAPRSMDGAVLQGHAAIAAQALSLALQVDSLCLHGDTEGCVEIAELVYQTLTDNGFEVGY